MTIGTRTKETTADVRTTMIDTTGTTDILHEVVSTLEDTTRRALGDLDMIEGTPVPGIIWDTETLGGPLDETATLGN